MACLRQQPHTAEEVSVFAAAHIATSATVDSNGLWCFRATAIVGADHQHIVTSGGQATVKLPRFKAVNALLGNLRTATTGNYQAFDFAKYAHRYLAEFQHWFNRRFDMKSILPRLLVALIGAPLACERVLRAAEVSRFQVSSRATVDEDRFVAKLDPSCQHRPFLAAQRFRPVRAVRQF